VATRGRYSLTGEPTDEEAIFVRLVSGRSRLLNLNRELYRGGMIQRRRPDHTFSSVD
jgi:hypothetical protein